MALLHTYRTGLTVTLDVTPAKWGGASQRARKAVHYALLEMVHAGGGLGSAVCVRLSVDGLRVDCIPGDGNTLDHYETVRASVRDKLQAVMSDVPSD